MIGSTIEVVVLLTVVVVPCTLKLPVMLMSPLTFTVPESGVSSILELLPDLRFNTSCPSIVLVGWEMLIAIIIFSQNKKGLQRVLFITK